MKDANEGPHNEPSVIEQNDDNVIIVTPVGENSAISGKGQMSSPIAMLSDHKAIANPNDSQREAVAVWLRDLDPDVLRSRHQNQASLENDQDGKGTPASFDNVSGGDETPFTPANPPF
ncbi:hypothetical protein HDU76_007723 [Blyttiomyces sp. JEL0837]|nr:hypothetical protein HDU76_007723 [Blyttiomyces sp. JEL0837]